MNPLLTKAYKAGAAIAACRLMKVGAADYLAIQATDGAAPILGASVQNMPAELNQTVDVVRAGLTYVEAGGSINRGQYVTADANGKAIAAVIVAGTPLYVAGTAEIAAVAGDLVPVMIAPCVIANDTGIVTADVTISSAELLALNATPKTLVAAPGAGKALILIDAQLALTYNSAAYAGIAAGEDLAIRYTDGNGAQLAVVETTGFLDQATSQYRHVYPLADAAKVPAANAALVAHMLTGEIITGNSPLKIRVRYRTVDLAF